MREASYQSGKCLYVDVVVSHVLFHSCNVMQWLLSFIRVYTKPGKQKILLDRGWDSNPRPSHYQNDALPSELQGQAENDLLSYDVNCISEVSPSMREASYQSGKCLYVDVVVSHVLFHSCNVMQWLLSFIRVYTKPGKQKILLDRGWDSNPRPSHYQNDALPSELQGQAENDLLSYDVNCISEVSPSMREASYQSGKCLYVDVVVSHVLFHSCNVMQWLLSFIRVYTKPGKQKILLDRGWDSNPRPSHYQNDALPSELQGQAENDLLSYDVNCISEVSPSMREASYQSGKCLYVDVVVSHVLFHSCNVMQWLLSFIRVYTKPGKQKILLDRGWDSNPRPSHYQNDALPSELQGQAENDLLSYDVNCISEVSFSMREASYQSGKCLYVDVVVSHVLFHSCNVMQWLLSFIRVYAKPGKQKILLDRGWDSNPRPSHYQNDALPSELQGQAENDLLSYDVNCISEVSPSMREASYQSGKCLYVDVVVSHVLFHSCNVMQWLLSFIRVYTKPGKQKILLDRGWDSNPLPSHYQNDALPSELQGQAENDLLSYDVNCISEVSPSMREASYQSGKCLYVDVVVSHVLFHSCNVMQWLLSFIRVYTKPGKQKILLDRGWDSNPRPSHYQNDALPSELQGQAENDLLSYDVNCISEVSPSMREASYQSGKCLYVDVVVSHVLFHSCNVMQWLLSFIRVYTKPGKQKILLDRGWDSNPRPSHYQNDALPSELQGQAENDLLSYDVNCISEVSPSMREASYQSGKCLYVDVVVSHVLFHSCNVMQWLLSFIRVYTKPGKQKILLDRGWDSNPRPSHYQNDALPSELQGQAENDLLSYDVNSRFPYYQQARKESRQLYSAKSNSIWLPM